MGARPALRRIAGQAAISVVAGLTVSAFAAAALVVGTVGSTERLALGRTLTGSLASVFEAVAGAGFLAGLVVFGCLIANEGLRGAGRWLVDHRRRLLSPFKAIAWLIAQVALIVLAALLYVARSEVFIELVSLARTVVVAAGLVLYWAAVVGGSLALIIGVVALGFYGITESTRMLVAMLDDPPRPVAMAYAIGGAFALMYVGIGAWLLSGWLAYRASRAGLRAAVRLAALTSVPGR